MLSVQKSCLVFNKYVEVDGAQGLAVQRAGRSKDVWDREVCDETCRARDRYLVLARNRDREL